MRFVKTIALIVACAFLALMSYRAAVPELGWCGSCPRERCLTVPGTAGKLQVVECGLTTTLHWGRGHIDVPIPLSFALVLFVTLAAALAGLAPAHQSNLKLLGSTMLATVFTPFAFQLAARTGEFLGFLSEPLFAGMYLVRGQAWGPLVLLSLTTAATIVSWLAVFRHCKRVCYQVG